MPPRSTSMLLAGVAALALEAQGLGAASAAQPVSMASHRAIYDLSLSDSTASKGVEAARGRIVFEFTGSPCEGYTQNFRQVTEISGGDVGTSMTDMRSSTYEEADGSTLRFSTEQRTGNAPPELTAGMARKAGAGVSVELKKPKPGTLQVSQAVFPTQQIIDLINAARDGRSTVTMKVFDGSEQARKVYETFSVIGKSVTHDHDGDLEDPLRSAGWDKLDRWPVTISYFDEGKGEGATPIYVIGFELLENGVTRALKLDYGNFGLKGALTRLDVLPTKPCN